MFEYRRPTATWVRVLIRECRAGGMEATVLRRGEAARGSLVIKLNHLEAGCRVLTQLLDAEGNYRWFQALNGNLVPEAEADAYIQRTVARDPDLWVIELAGDEDRNPFLDQIL